MKTIEISEIEITDEILLIRNGELAGRLLPPAASLVASQPAPRPEVGDAKENPSHFVVAQPDDAMDKEIAAYEAQHQELIQHYLGQYVALHNGEVVDHDADRRALRSRINTKYPKKIVLVRKVEAELLRTIYVRSPKVRRAVSLFWMDRWLPAKLGFENF